MSATRYLASLVALAATAALLTGASLARADGITSEQAQDIINELKQIRQTLEKMQSPQAAPAPDDKVSYKFSPGGFSMGDAKAPLVIVEYTDLQCPFCQQFHNTAFAQIKANYIDTGKVRFVSRDFPLDFHENARRSAVAAALASLGGRRLAAPALLRQRQAAVGSPRSPRATAPARADAAAAIHRAHHHRPRGARVGAGQNR